jgi:hydrogenase expression/formation protein HypC
MCFAIPMRVIDTDGATARCEARGVVRTVSLLLLAGEPLAPGDIVAIHLGHAVQKMTVEAARAAWELYDQVLAAADAPLDTESVKSV